MCGSSGRLRRPERGAVRVLRGFWRGHYRPVAVAPCFLGLFRRRNRLDHQPLHLFNAQQGLQKNAELNGPKSQKLHQLGTTFRCQRAPVGLHIEIVAISKAPLERRRHPPDVPFFEGQLPDRFQFWGRIWLCSFSFSRQRKGEAGSRCGRRVGSRSSGQRRYGVLMLVKRFTFKRNNDKGGFRWTAQSERDSRLLPRLHRRWQNACRREGVRRPRSLV